MAAYLEPAPPQWVKSSASKAMHNCVEVARLPYGEIGVRDSKDPEGLILKFAPAAWRAFMAGPGRE